MPDVLICLKCGRKGTRGFHCHSGDWFESPGRVSWACDNQAACDRRAAGGRPTDRHKRQSLRFRPSAALGERLDAHLMRTGQPVNAVLEQALTAHLDRVDAESGEG